MPADALRERFRALHADGIFVMPNAWDIGSARILESLRFASVATTSSGHAASLGRVDRRVTRDELIGHVEALTAAINIPLSVDAEACFADASGGVAETVRLVARAGAAGISIEDYDASSPSVLARERAVDAVRQAADVARELDWHARRTGRYSPAPASSWTAEPPLISTPRPPAQPLAELFNRDR